MRREWEPEELIASWTLLDDDWRLVGNKTGATRLRFSLMGGRRESHPPAPPEPGVNLSAHRAPIIRFVLRPHVG